MEDNKIEIRPFDKDVISIDLSSAELEGNHGGGDNSLMKNLYFERNGIINQGMSYLDVSIDSHLMAFNADKARLENKIIKIEK